MTVPRPARRVIPWLAAALATIPCLISSTAWASPGLDGVRNLGMATTGRASTSGTNAALAMPSHMSMSPQFAVEPIYQTAIKAKRHGIGVVVMDSLNNGRVALALGYVFMRGSPRASYQLTPVPPMTTGEDRDMNMVHYGHEVFAAVSVSVVKRFLSVAIKPKYQYTSLRYHADDGRARNATSKINAFGLDIALSANLFDWVHLAVAGQNLVGNGGPAYTEEQPLSTTGLDVAPDTLDPGTVSRVADYPRGVVHGVALYPLKNRKFSLNFDGAYDFTSYRERQDTNRVTRKAFGGSAEFVWGPVPIRAGALWDGRGRGGRDDMVFVGVGLGYVRPAPVGGVGVDVGVGVMQQVTGARLETVLGFNLGIQIHPDL